ncbi:DUF7680 family protein [Pyxidicoccus caerfyrddinensis]|uniref:DUF7680 family protein n=1 Tax=Pyxidicoccus caerfyrddinensis TaxID=2709663 RepID=UPI0013D929D7|nr:hypothetical protein [Pyxidicoccus caerfyrddinensis]
MERFRLRVRQEAKRGQIWELHLFPNVAGRLPKEADAKIMGSSASPETIQWLRELSDPFLQQAEEPGLIKASDFRPSTSPRWLRRADGMRLALAFASARYLTKPAQRIMFRSGLLELPAEVVLYWFTLCFYGYRQQAGRAALRTLLTYEQAEDKPKAKSVRGRKSSKESAGPTLFDTNWADSEPTEGKIKPRAKKRTTSSR